jgi:hypothetical protein
MLVSPNRRPARATRRTDGPGPAARRRRIARAATTAAGLAALAVAGGVRPPAAGAQVVYRRVDLGAANSPSTESFIDFVSGGTYTVETGGEIVVGDGLPAAEVVPEPAPLALVAGALVLLGAGAARRRRGAPRGRRSGR